MGSVTLDDYDGFLNYSISTHTLRGERDLRTFNGYTLSEKFQLTRSVGSVTIQAVQLKRVVQ